MSGAWTPGPWEWSDYFYGIYGSRGEDVLSAQDGFQYDEYSGDPATIVVSAANAHLIAASPDLYAALDDALKALAQFVDTSFGTQKPYEHPLSAYDRGQDALAKARGEAK